MKSLSSINNLIHNWPQFREAIEKTTELSGSNSTEIYGIQGSLFSFFTDEYLKNTHFKTLQALQYKNTSKNSFEYKTYSSDLLIVVPGEYEASNLFNDFKSLFPDFEVYVLPSWGTIPYRPCGCGSITFGQRAGFLSKLCLHNTVNTLKNKIRIFIVTQRSFISKFPSPEYISKNSFTLKVRDSFDTIKIAKKLSDMGYTKVSRVSVKGEFSLRGEVLDIFLPLEDNPFRVIFDFDEISSIKIFETDSQTTIGKTEEIFINPMKEVIWNEDFVSRLEKQFADYEATAIDNADSNIAINPESSDAQNIHLAFTPDAQKFKENLLLELNIKKESEAEEFYYSLLWDKDYSILDYLEPNTTIFLYDYDKLLNGILGIKREYSGMYRKAREMFPVLPPESILFNFEKLTENLKDCVKFRTLSRNFDDEKNESPDSNDFSENNNGVSKENRVIIKINAEPARSFFGNINFIKDELEKLQNDDWNIFIYADNENQMIRLNEVFKNYVTPENSSLKPVILLPDSITSGFNIPEIKLLVIQENEIFGRRKYVPKSTSKAKSQAIDTFVELSPGDYVVHVNYGIGLFHGIERVKALGNERDYIKLEYEDEEFVFVPIEQVNLVQRYIGNEGEKPKLDRIGSKSWENRKNKVQQKVEEIAQKLIDLYSRRKASTGYAFPKEVEWQAAFEAAFPYEDTPDQIQVTEDIKKDMEKPVPMDRLVCGDVGYGKTEMAMRAAFKAVMGGKQVAFLAPTTILAEQHYENCIERFKNFPVKIAHLSRFVTPSEQKKILTKVQLGEVDILIGTHRIIQKDVVFKNLGLMIIDEEQRFGVKDKEKLKVMKNNIDCLTMSATPIPRTLHMSLLKIRDMSLLTTPPQNRQPIETVISEVNDSKIAFAIRQEMDRGGQIFYLHNRVETLEEVRSHIERLVPECIVDIAHGQMTSQELDDIFHRFKMGAFHVLIATTIIENGIDIPNVNTIIIDRADMYGVSQLYQLRGRVGRSDRKAYAYLFYPENKVLSEVAMKRLQVISDFTELGSGFKIAMKDMEIRGAGNLLGKDQSGDVYAVGFDLYVRLLNEAVQRLTQQKDYQIQNEVLMEMEYTGYIPDSYVTNPQVKMEIYKKIAAISTDSELEAVVSELDDRFGPIPDEVYSLLALSEIRIICKKLGIKSIKEHQGEVKVEFNQIEKISIDKLMKLVTQNPGTVKLNPAVQNIIVIKLGKIGLKEKSEFIREKLSMLLS